MCLGLPDHLLFSPAKAFICGFEMGFMISALAGWPSHIKPDPMFAVIMQVNLWLPRDMEGVRGLVIGRCPGMNGFEGLSVCTDTHRLPASQVKGLEGPKAAGRMICTSLCLEDLSGTQQPYLRWKLNCS